MKDTCSYQSLFCEITEFPARKRPELSADAELQLHWINALEVNKLTFINSFSEILIRLLLKNKVLVKDIPQKS